MKSLKKNPILVICDLSINMCKLKVTKSTYGICVSIFKIKPQSKLYIYNRIYFI